MARAVLLISLGAVAVLAPSERARAQTCTATTQPLFSESFDTRTYQDPASSVDGWGHGAITPVRKSSMLAGAAQSVGQQVYLVADGDWDGDGWTDMVALVLQPTCHLHYLRNRRTGGSPPVHQGFDPGGAVGSAGFASYSIASPPSCGTESPILLAGDFDGDGHKDLLYMRVANENAGGLLATAVIYRFVGMSGGVPQFAPPVDVASQLGNIAWHWTGTEAKLVDWPPADGIADLVVLNSQGFTNELRLYKGTGSLGFTAPVTLVPNLGFSTRIADQTHPASGTSACPPTVSRGGTALAVGDFDGDGNLDVIAGSVSEKDLRYWKGDSGGTFTSAGVIPFAEGGADVALAADFDGDGDLDVMIGRDGWNCGGVGGTVWMLENDGKGNFTKHSAPIANLGDDLDFGVAFNVDNDPDGRIDAIYADGNNSGTYTTVMSQTSEVYNLTGTGISLPVADLSRTNDAIVSVMATWTAENLAPPARDILVYASNDDGKTWEQVTRGQPHTFSSYGTVLRWKAVFQAPAETLTGADAAFAPGCKLKPTLDDLTLSFDTVDRRAYSRSAVAYGDVDPASLTSGERLYSAYYWFPGFQAHLLSYDISALGRGTASGLERVDDQSAVSLVFDGGDLLNGRRSASRTIYAAYAADGDGRVNDRVSFSESEVTSPTTSPTLQAMMSVDDATRVAAVRFVRGMAGAGGADRPWKLYDVGHSSPVFVGPTRTGDAHADYMAKAGSVGYSTFARNNANRAPVVYLGANDGMLHAFDAVTGDELWALVPNNLLAKVKNQRAVSAGVETYAHDFFVDGKVTVGEIYDGGAWKTVAVVAQTKGQGKGGNNYYFAVDITSPTSPQPLWEFTDTRLPSPLACTLPVTRTTTVCSSVCGSSCTDPSDEFIDDANGVISIEAESPSGNASVDGWHRWQQQNDVAGYSGAGFMEATPDVGTSCNSVTSCGAHLTYPLQVSTRADYFVFFRLNGPNNHGDRIRWGIDGVATSDTPTVGSYGAWQWIGGDWVQGGGQTAATLGGDATLDVWMARDGARVDKIVLKKSPGAPTGTGPDQLCCHQSCTQQPYQDEGDESKEWPECGAGSGLTCCKASLQCRPIASCNTPLPADPVTGETWSPPVIARVKVGGRPTWVVFFGSGYNNRGSDVPLVGRSLYAVDAGTGAQVGRWDVDDIPYAAGVNPSTIDNTLPGGAAVADVDSDGYADALYVGDLEGRLWRLDTRADAPSVDAQSAWTLTAIFDAGGFGGGARVWAPIITKPALAVLPDPGGAATRSVYVYFGTGGDDRAPADQSYAFYAVRDDGTATTRTRLVASDPQEFRVAGPAGFKYWADPIIVSSATVYFTALQGSIESVNPCDSLGGSSKIFGYAIRTIGGTKHRAGQPVMDPVDASGKIRQTLVLRGDVSTDPAQAVTPERSVARSDLLMQTFAAGSAQDRPAVQRITEVGIQSTSSRLKVLYWREVPLP